MGVFETDDEIKGEVDRFYGIARESLATVWRAVEAVAAALLKHEDLDRDGVDAALDDIDIYLPIFAGPAGARTPSRWDRAQIVGHLARRIALDMIDEDDRVETLHAALHRLKGWLARRDDFPGWQEERIIEIGHDARIEDGASFRWAHLLEFCSGPDL